MQHLPPEHVPPVPAQQSDDEPHGSASAEHAHAPPAHDPLQQSADCAQLLEAPVH
jgi:hypothetical protein